MPVVVEDAGGGRLSFTLGTSTGDERCLELMGAIQGEGELPFTRGEAMASFLMIVEACNSVSLFQ
eukprot:2619127-Rhodomonas_salina.1